MNRAQLRRIAQRRDRWTEARWRRNLDIAGWLDAAKPQLPSPDQKPKRRWTVMVKELYRQLEARKDCDKVQPDQLPPEWAWRLWNIRRKAGLDRKPSR